MPSLDSIGRKLGTGLVYAAALLAARWFAFQIRFDFDVPADNPHAQMLRLGWMWEIPLKLACLYAFGQFSGLLGYFSLPDLKRTAQALALATVVLWLGRIIGPPMTLSRGILLSDFVLGLVAVAAVRVGFRVAHEAKVKSKAPMPHWCVGIVGAGDAGATLAKELLAKPGLGLKPAAFFDDDRTKWGSQLHGIRVVGSPNTIPTQAQALGLERIIIAMPSAPPRRIRELTELLTQYHIRCEIIPGLDQLATGTVKVLALRPVEIGDLLGREAVQINHDNISAILAGKTVAVTGAGGSIGQELCRQVLGFKPARLLLLDRSEVQLFQIEQELAEKEQPTEIVPLVADVSDERQAAAVLHHHRPQVIYHAAAHKHVPIMQRQPAEALRNNSLGTAALAELSRACGVERFVLISTDKAINPTSFMGLSKRLAEIYLQALQAEAPQTRFMAVRFGNVLGSSGSVIPVFQRQIVRGGPVLVTHPEVSRYFMTIPEAVALVLQASALGAGGEIFMLDMGQPIKIVDLARQLIVLQGLRPDEDIEIRFIGLRPGEKLVEDIRHRKENTMPTSHPKILRYTAPPPSLAAVRAAFEAVRREETAGIPQAVLDLVPEYQPKKEAK
jgi:FlaA1/EpsC-like NDP-sugar epimerase